MARPKKEILPATQFEKIGAPQKIIKREQFEELCFIQGTQEEICAVLDVDDQTLGKWLMRTYGLAFEAAWKKFSQGGKMSLRRKLFAIANNDNAKSQLGAAIWLSKQHLGMTERSIVNSTNVNMNTTENPQVSSLVQAALELMNGKVLNEAATKTVSATTGINVNTGPGSLGQVDATTKIQGKPI